MYNPDLTEETFEEREEERQKYETLAKIVLPRFSVGGMTAFAMRQRLSEIRKAGYPVQNYKGLNQEQLRNFYMRIQEQIKTQARDRCPEVVLEINAWNAQRRKESQDPFMR